MTENRTIKATVTEKMVKDKEESGLTWSTLINLGIMKNKEREETYHLLDEIEKEVMYIKKTQEEMKGAIKEMREQIQEVQRWLREKK